MSDSASEIDEKELVRIIGGTIDDMKDFVEEENPDRQLLKKFLEDEKVAKDRKTAKKYLQKKIKEKEVGGEFTRARDEIEDVQNTLERIREEEIGNRDFSGDETGEVNSVEEIDLLEGDYEDVEKFLKERNPSVEIARELREGEEKAQDRKNVKELLKRYARQKKLYKDIKNAEYHIGKIREDFAEIEEDSEYISGDLKVSRPHEAVKEEHGDEEQTEEEKEEKVSEEASSEEDEAEEDENLEEKKALLEQLEVDISEEKLKNIDKEQLEELRDEKSEREKLIEDLEEIGMEEEELKDSSTEDLRKLKQEMVGDDAASEEESDKNEAKIEQEAEEDLEMLMGSTQTSETEDEGSDPLDQLKEIKSRFKEAWNTPEREEEEKTQGIDGDKVVALLDDYEDLPEKEQAIKTAHVMKGYLEFQMDIEREMTYEELAETLGEVEDPSENLQLLKMFFESMAEDQYLDRIEIENIEQVNYSSREIVEELG
jgi:hypothetical protein